MFDQGRLEAAKMLEFAWERGQHTPLHESNLNISTDLFLRGSMESCDFKIDELMAYFSSARPLQKSDII